MHLGNGVCKTGPCNNGTCVPHFDGSGRFTCDCEARFYGPRCDIPGADMYFSFDKDTSHPNKKKPVGDIAMKLKDGRLVRVPDRRGRVLAVWNGKQAVELVVEKPGVRGRSFFSGVFSVKRLKFFRQLFILPRTNFETPHFSPQKYPPYVSTIQVFGF